MCAVAMVVAVGFGGGANKVAPSSLRPAFKRSPVKCCAVELVRVNSQLQRTRRSSLKSPSRQTAVLVSVFALYAAFILYQPLRRGCMCQAALQPKCRISAPLSPYLRQEIKKGMNISLGGCTLPSTHLYLFSIALLSVMPECVSG